MRREQRVSDRVYTHLFPRPGPSDPPNFTAHLNTNLVGEVRIETQRFYGGLETVEARYPGLNYTYPPHIKRLSYFPHHARLFHAFNELRLTDSEILGLCRWEGTLWARQRYEKDEGVKVLDTTGKEIKPWEPKKDGAETPKQASPSRRATRSAPRRSLLLGQGSPQRVTSGSTLQLQLQASGPDEAQTADEAPAHPQPQVARDVEMHDEDDDVESALSQRLTAQGQPQPLTTTEAYRRMQLLASLRERGESVSAMDPEFEQFLKDSADEQQGDAPQSSLASLLGGSDAAHTIASVMTSMAQTQAAVSVTVDAPSSGGAGANAVEQPPEVDVL